MFVRLLQDHLANTGFGAVLGAGGDAWVAVPAQEWAPNYLHPRHRDQLPFAVTLKDDAGNPLSTRWLRVRRSVMAYYALRVGRL